MALINTIHGPLEEDTLARTIGLEVRPALVVIWAEWRRGNELVRRDAFPITKTVAPDVVTVTYELRDLPTDMSVGVCWHDAAGVLVRRDAHVIQKHPSVEAMAVAAALA